MKNIILKQIISFLLKKKGGETIPLSGPEVFKNDNIYIHLIKTVDNSEEFYTVESVDKNVLKCIYYIDHQKKNSDIEIKTIKNYTIQVRYYFKTWKMIYNNLFEPVLDVLFLTKFKWFLQRQHDKSLQLNRDKMVLMKTINQIREKKNEIEIDVMDIMAEIHGEKIRLSPNHRFVEQTIFLLRSIGETGEIETENNYFIKVKVNPKIITTLHEYETEQTRHKDLCSLHFWQVIVAAGMLILTLSNIISAMLN